MARTPLPVTGITRDNGGSISPEPADAVNGNSIPNPGDVVLVLTNTDGSTHTAQIQITQTIDGQPVNPRSVTVPAGQIRYAGPYDTSRYSSNLLVDVDSSDLAIAAFRFGTSISVSVGSGPFVLNGLTLIADLDEPGLTTDNDVLIVDTAVTPSVLDGTVLSVTV